MALFEFRNDETINSFRELKSKTSQFREIVTESTDTFSEEGMELESAVIPSTDFNLENQFLIFQLGTKREDPAILESSQVNPAIKGSDDEPDVLVSMEMLSFCIGSNEDIDKNTRATLRINIGKDENSRDRQFDTAFWSIAAGLNLYNQATNKKTEPKELKSNFRRAFGNRPIEVPGGLSKMSFEVVKHEEPKWWQRVFSFIQSDTGKSLISTIGFPAITNQAIHVIDELLNRLDQNEPKILFKSSPLRLALSQQAKDDFTAGNEKIAMGSLNPGICVLARGRDYETILDANPLYYPAFDKLVPAGVTEKDLLAGRYDDPFKNMTYALFKVGMKQTKLDPIFNFGA